MLTMPTRTSAQEAHARKQPKQARSRQLVADVLEAAARVFDREGLDATTNRVAQEAGVSVGSLYQYFPNKRALLTALAHRHLDVATELLQRAAEEHENAETLEEFVRALVGAVLKEHRAHPHLRRLLRSIDSSDAELATRFAECVGGAQERLVWQLERLRPGVVNPRLRARLVTAAIDGLVHHDELEFDDEFENEVVALCVGYLER
jgi:AcrR family transcriptional regulator